LEILNQEIISCGRCPRLREHSAEVAQLKRRAYREQTYWGLPVPSFGDPEARILGNVVHAQGRCAEGLAVKERILKGEASTVRLRRSAISLLESPRKISLMIPRSFCVKS